MSYQYITNDYDAAQAIRRLSDWKRVGFDTETTGLDPTRDGVFLRLVTIAPPSGDVCIFDVWRLSAALPLLRRFFESNVQKVAHNAKFDAKFIWAGLGAVRVPNLVCTMLAHQVTMCGQLDWSASLDASVHQFLPGAKWTKDASQQTSDWAADELTTRQLAYAAQDAAILLPLWDAQQHKLMVQGQMRVSQIEFAAIEAFAAIEYNGILLDEGRWREVLEKVTEQWHAKRALLQDLLRMPKPQGQLFDNAVDLLNPNSPQQVIPALKRLRIPIPLDNDGRETLRAFRLEPIAVRYNVVRELLEYKKLQKARSSYGLNWLEYINPRTGRIHPDIHQIGALTGRTAFNKPNTQQPPRGEMYRRCFVAEPGHYIVNGDWSQIELRIIAELSGDRAMTQAFLSGIDFHLATANLTGQPRDVSKNINFATAFGAGITRFALMAKISEDRAEQAMNADKAAFPQKYSWLAAREHEAVTTKQSKTLTGRLSKYEFDPADKSQVGLIKRNGRNTPVQGLCADIAKIALGKIQPEIAGRDDMRLVHFVHDENLLEVAPESVAEAAAIVNEYMHEAAQPFFKRVPVQIDVHYGKEWQK